MALAVCLLPLTPGARADTLPAPYAQAGGISSYQLDNGFRIILAPYPGASTARVELLVKVGSKQEGYGETGMAHLLEHMLFKRAGERDDLKRELTALGASWNGTTNADRTNYFATLAADPEKLDELIRIEADRFIRPAFTADDLAVEMTVVRNELERKDDDPGSVLSRALLRQSFFWHGYGRPTIGARSDIENAPFEALRAFHRRHYRPDNAALIVSGGFDPQRVLSLAAQRFGEAARPLEPKPGNWTREDASGVTSRSELLRERGVQAASLAWRLPGANERQTIAIDLAAAVLCEESTGGLRKALVHGRKLAHTAACGVQGLSDYSLLIASASTDKRGDPAALADALKATIDEFARTGLDARQLERARRSRKAALERLAGSHGALAGRLSAAEAAGDWRLLLRYREIVDALSLDEVNQALKHWLSGVAPNEALLRHGRAPRLPLSPAPISPAPLSPVPAAAPGNPQGWPAPPSQAAMPPGSLAELAGRVREIPLDDPSIRASLLPQRTPSGLVSLGLINHYGSEASLRGRHLACSMASRMLALGGVDVDRESLNARLEAMRAKVSFGLGHINITAPAEHLAEALERVLAVRKAPLLPEAEFERLRAGSIAGIEATADSAGGVIGNLLALRFDNYPAGHHSRTAPFDAQLAELRALTLDEVRRCATDFGGRSVVHYAIVGDYQEDAVRQLADKIRRLPVAAVAYQRIELPAPPAVVDTRDILVTRPDTPNARIVAHTQLPIGRDDADYPALYLAVRLLGGDNDSRIRQRLREKEGMSYSAGTTLTAGDADPRGFFFINASVASENADKARAILQAELNRAMRDGFSDSEVTRARLAWREFRRRGTLQESSLAQRLASAMYRPGELEREARLDAGIARLGSTEVNHALRKYLGAAPMVWATSTSTQP